MACVEPAKLSPYRSRIRSSVSCVASTAPWPARAWSEWPWVITAVSTGRVGSIWKPPSLQHTPAGVGRRMSSGRIGVRYGVNAAMTGGPLPEETTMKHVLPGAIAAIALLTHSASAQDKPELPQLRLVVGG